MTEFARSEGEYIRLALERNDPSSTDRLRRSMKADLASNLTWIKVTPQVRAAVNIVVHETTLFLDDPGVEEQRKRAIRAAESYELALAEAEPSWKAIAVGH